jgi:hypothetical protein
VNNKIGQNQSVQMSVFQPVAEKQKAADERINQQGSPEGSEKLKIPGQNIVIWKKRRGISWEIPIKKERKCPITTNKLNQISRGKLLVIFSLFFRGTGSANVTSPPCKSVASCAACS